MNDTIYLSEADIRLKPVGEIRFGPELYELFIANKKIENSSFFEWFVYSKELNILAITEYIYSSPTEYYTQLFLLDLKNGKRADYGRFENGLTKPKQIEERNLIFTRESGDGIIKEFEVPLAKISDWKSQ